MLNFTELIATRTVIPVLKIFLNCSLLWECLDVVDESSQQLLLALVKQTAEIKQQVMHNTALLQDLNRRQRGIDRDKVGQTPCNFPLETYQSVLCVEQKLKSKEFYSQLVSV